MTAAEVLSGLDPADLVGALGAALRDPVSFAALATEIDSPEVLLWFRERRREIGAGVADDAIRLLRAHAKTLRRSIATARRFESGPEPGVYRERTYPEPGVLALLQRTEPRGEDAEPKIRRNAWNLGTILREDSRWKGRFRWNDLRCDMEVRDDGVWRQIADVDDVNLCRWISDTYGLDYATGMSREQVLSVASEHRVNPVGEYLDALPAWDGVERLSYLLPDHFGAEHTELHAAIGRCWMVSLVARALEPGCKVDTVPILYGSQGTGKSTVIRALVPEIGWYTDADIPFHHSQDQYQVLQGKWILELAEFDRYSSKVDAAKLKAYVTQQVDSFRESYGRRTTDRPRRIGFVGTTNLDEIFGDATGARRFWPIRCGVCRPDGVRAVRDQLWAEALLRYRRGDGWLLSREQSREIAEVADSFRQTDPWEMPVAEYVLGRPVVTVDEILRHALEIPSGGQDRASSNRVTAILRTLEWEKDSKRGPPRGKGPFQWRPPQVGQ